MGRFRRTISRFLGTACLLVAGSALLVGLPAPPALAGQAILGAGSTFAFPALSAWMADVARQSLTVNYNSNGSALGRQAFWTAQADFAASDIPFQGTNCPPGAGTCQNELLQVANSHRSFQYMPIVAGGESIDYNLQINGHEFTGLRLDSLTLAKIFTGVITTWNDPAIAADNPGVALPGQPIQVVVHSEGAGDSYNLSAYLANQQPGVWDAFANANGLNPPDAPTEYWPCGSLACHAGAAHFVGQNGSDGVINFIASPSGSGSIGYDETAYAVESGVPMASIKNAAGVYVQPAAISVAVALSRATINADHTESLGAVYVNPDPRTYPISSYSYAIVPTNTTAPMNPSKGQTLSSFINYYLCQGQQDALHLRYAPLPVNLVELGLGVEQQVPGAVPPASVAHCNNPAITENWYALNGIGAPTVLGAGPGAGSSNAAAQAAAAAAAAANAAHPGANPAAAAASNNSKSGTSQATGGTTAGSVAAALGNTTTTAGANGATASQLAAARPTNPPHFGSQWGPEWWVAAVIGAVVVGLALGPPAISLRRRAANTRAPAPPAEGP